MDEKIPLLIDTDPGVDDALALLMAFADDRHDVVGLSIAAGNVGLAHTVRNALKLCEVAGRADIPVHAGCDAPLLHPAMDAAFVHGQDGFGDTGYAPAARAPDTEHAANAIVRLSHEHADKLLLVALGPLTNLALALKLDPTLPGRIGRCVVMGGAVTGHGNMTPAAEFNIAFDPEAAHVVFSAFGQGQDGRGPRIELADWEANLRHGFAHDAFEGWLQAGAAVPGGGVAGFYDTISRHTRDWARKGRGEDWHSADALAMALALQPDGALETVDRPVSIELAGTLTRGASVVDWGRQSGKPDNVTLLARYDQARYEARIKAALAV